MVILNIEVLVPGDQVGKVLGSVSGESGKPEEVATSGPANTNGNSRPMNQQPASRPAPKASKSYMKYYIRICHQLINSQFKIIQVQIILMIHFPMVMAYIQLL